MEIFVFINDILQIPGESYSFPGGATITFDEPPKAEDTLKILFYRGTGGADVIDRDIVESVKVTRRGKVRRSRLYSLRGLTGRKARIKERR